MEAKELMIGDWVLCPDNMQRQVRYLQVRPSVIGIGGSSYDEDEIQPIPLTPEILEQNGFVKQAYDGWLISENNGRGLIEYRTDCFDGMLRINYTKKPFSKISIKLKHVHELQHALRLCGINKEIEV